jgi:hypothetical protein
MLTLRGRVFTALKVEALSPYSALPRLTRGGGLFLALKVEALPAQVDQR